MLTAETGMTILLPVASISYQMLFLVAVIPLSLAVGFALGLLYERWYNFSALQRLTGRFEKLFQSVSKTLEKADRACQIFNQHPQSRQLTSKQRATIGTLGGRLTGELNRIVEACQKQDKNGKTDSAGTKTRTVSKKLKPFRLPDWMLKPIDDRTEFPDATAYQNNLKLLFAAMQQTDIKSAVLFIKLDHYPRHAKRFGCKVADCFVKKAGSILLRRLREEDFLAQVTDDLLIAIVPNIQSNAMQKIANSARQAIRSHRFVNPETEQEVFVTASFSYTMFDETVIRNKEPEQELWDRCQNALAASQKQGRCQLHEMTDLGISRLIAG